VAFLSAVENLEVEPGAGAAKVIINSRTGTVVISSHVIVTPAAVSHGSLSVTIKEEQTVSQPNPFSKLGQTVVINNSTIKVDQGSNRMFLFKPGVELDQIVRAVKRCRRRPRRFGRHSRGAAGSRRAPGRAHCHLNDHFAANDFNAADAWRRTDRHVRGDDVHGPQWPSRR